MPPTARAKSLRLPDKQYLLSTTLWLVLAAMAWSLPVLSYLHIRAQRADLQSGHYYHVSQTAADDTAPTPTH